jgi:hypothetical protein
MLNMKQLLIASLVIISLSSCLKQSIADAMIDHNYRAQGSASVATMTFAVNGNTVTTSVKHPDTQSPTGYELGCSKTFYPGTNFPIYNLDCVATSGEITFTFFTDSLAVGNYTYTTGMGGDMFVLDYNYTSIFVHDPADKISFNITSYTKGHISGNFSGKLTPMVAPGYPLNTYGTPGSILITQGSFKDVPVFY